MEIDGGEVFNMVLNTIFELAGGIKYPDENGKMLNERYIHHLFSHKMQEKLGTINLFKSETNILHPEWPTFKKTSKIEYARYKGKKPNDNGKAGHLDFAIGDYNSPEIGLEFKLTYGSPNLIFDMVKLMDKANPFKFAILFGVILREKGLPKGKDEKNIRDSIMYNFTEACNHLKNRFAEDRKYVFIIIEVDNFNSRFWYFDGEELKSIDNLNELEEKVRTI